MGLMPLQRCCCWDNVRSGSIASAIYTMIITLFAITGSTVEIVFSDEAQAYTNSTFQKAEESALKVGAFVDIAITVVLFINAVLLLIGIFKNNKYLLLPYIINLCILIPLQCFVALLHIFFMFFVANHFVPNAIFLLVWVAFILLDIYCLLCVISHFQNLHAGREEMRAEYRQHGERLPEPDLPDSERFEARSEPPAPLPTAGGKGSGFAYQPVVEFRDDEEAPPPYRPIV